jgi:hypothetical protein
MDADHISCPSDHQPRSPIGEAKYLLLGRSPLLPDILLQPIRHLLGDEYDLLFLTALRLVDGELPVPDISRGEFQDLPYSHPAPGHKLQYDPLPGIPCPEDDLIHNLFVHDLPLNLLGHLEDLSQDGGVARILEIRVKRSSDVVEEAPKEGESEFPGGLLGSLACLGQEGQDFFLGQGFWFPVAEVLAELGEEEVIVAGGGFFLNLPRGSR